MHSVYLDEEGLRFRTDYQPSADPGEIPVAISLAGICETDLQLVQGYMGFVGILGHEFVGVAQAGRFTGQRVVGEINCRCGKCVCCAQNMGNHCPHRSVIGILNHDGAFAETVFVPEENLHPVPDGVADQVAVFTEPLAAAFQIPAQLNLNEFPQAAVIGDGRLSYLIAQVLSLHGCAVTVVGKHASKLSKYAHLGLSTKLLHEITKPERQFDLAVDCTGSPTGIPTAMKLLRPRGTLVLKTTHAGQHGPNLAPLVIDEVTLVGSRCGPFDVALRALASGEVEVESLITGRFQLADAEAAFVAATEPGQGKILFRVT